MGSDCYCALCCGPLSIYSIKIGSRTPKALKRRRKRVENKRRRLNGEKVIHEDSKQWEDEEKEEDERAKSSGTNGDVVMKDANNGPKENSDETVHDIEIDGEEEEMEEEWEDEHDHEVDSHSESASSHDPEENESEDVDLDDYDERSEHLSQASEICQHPSYGLDNDSKDETSSMFNYHEEHSYDPDKICRADVDWVDRTRVLAINKEMLGSKKAFLSGRGRYNDYVSLCFQHPACSRDSGADESTV
jgi:hypothetical protein